MLDLKTAITVVEYIVAFIVVLLLGNLLGHKIGRWRLTSYAGIATLVIIVAFTIFAAIVLRQSR